MKPKPIILGGDGRILKHPIKLALLKSAEADFAYLAEGYVNLSFQHQVFKVLKAWDNVCLTVSRGNEPSIFRIGVRNETVQAIRFADYRGAKSWA